MWREFAGLYVLHETRPPTDMAEERMFYDKLMEPRHRSFVQQIQEHMRLAEQSRLTREAATAVMTQKSFDVFRSQILECHVWRRLAVNKGLLPDATFDYASFDAAALAQLPEQGVDSWLRPAWDVLG